MKEKITEIENKYKKEVNDLNNKIKELEENKLIDVEKIKELNSKISEIIEKNKEIENKYKKEVSDRK